MIFIAASPLAEIVLPTHRSDVTLVVRILSIAGVAAGVHVVIGNGLWALGRPQFTIWGDLVRGTVGVGLGILTGIYAGAAGCALGLLIGNTTGSAILLAKYRQMVSSPMKRREFQ
jgi:O-antigen/teichoic acid export membrane protein